MNAHGRVSVFNTLKVYFATVAGKMKSSLKSFSACAPYLLSSGEMHKEVTEQYPDPISARTADDLPARTRGLLYNDIGKCTGCKECEWVCPTRAIHVETEAGSDPSKLWVAIYDIDFGRCVFCGLCVDSCQPHSLIHTRQYEGAVYLPADMKVSFGRGFVTPEQKEKWAEIRSQISEGEVTL